MLKTDIITKEAGTALANMLKVNTVLTELDISDCAHFTAGADGPGFAQELAVGISDNGTLLSLDLSKNNIGGHNGEPGVHALAKMLNGTLQKLNISNNRLDVECANILAPVISGNRALLKLDISNNGFYAAGAKALAEALRDNQTMTELNAASNGLGQASLDRPDVSGVIALADTIKDMGTLSFLDISKNNIGELVMSDGWQYDKEQDEYWKVVDGDELVEKQLPEGEQLVTLIPAGAIAFADAIKDMVALSSLGLAGNKLGLLATEDGWTSEAGNNSAPWVHPDGQRQDETPAGLKSIGVLAIANAIRETMALSALDLQDNNISSEEKSTIKAICDAKSISLQL
jgi:hypothetical protein